MSKTREAKKVNRVVKKLNKQLVADVFKDRFFIRQLRKTFGCDNVEYFQFELIDKEQPERNQITKWYNSFEICHFVNIHREINDFIVNSDFWEKHREREGV